MNTIKTLFATASVVLCAAAAPAWAQAPMDHSNMPGMKAGDAEEMSDAEVRKIDKEQGKVTLKHGPIKNLDMPGMTMVFGVKDKALLDAVQVGDKVKFRATSENGKITVLEMTKAK
ncbi:MAG: copper-binding protein [Leptothrix sp. (in: Bacteria)]|nr:copper-binding protein [Leptothrix sp. (in: b-proteobacteria)]